MKEYLRYTRRLNRPQGLLNKITMNPVIGIGRFAAEIKRHITDITVLLAQVFYWIIIGPFKGKIVSRKSLFEQMVFSEATVAFPLLASYVYHKGNWEHRKAKKLNQALSN